MNTPLRDALHELAEHHTFVPDSTAWDRGRRARRHDRLLVAAAVLVLVASLGGIGMLGAQQRTQPIADSVDEGAIPAQLHEVPERLVHHQEHGATWDERIGSSELAIGQGSMAFMGGGGAAWGLPVVIDAQDGSYHLLDLPGWVGNGPMSAVFLGEGAGLSLSPDGLTLAWSYGQPARGREDYSPVETGIRIADLVTGEVTEVSLQHLLTQGQALIPHILAWSPDGSVLGWRAREMAQWNSAGAGPAHRLPGRQGIVDVATGQVTDVRMPGVGRAGVEIAVTNDAGLILRGQKRAFAWRDGNAVPADDLVDEAFGDRQPGPGTYQSPVDTRFLGRIDTSRVAALVTSRSDSLDDSGAQLVVMTDAGVPMERASWRIATRWDLPQPSTLSIAVDLLGVDPGASPPGVTGVHDFPAPTWPWSTERKVAVTALAVLATLSLMALVLHLARRRRGRYFSRLD